MDQQQYTAELRSGGEDDLLSDYDGCEDIVTGLTNARRLDNPDLDKPGKGCVSEGTAVDVITAKHSELRLETQGNCVRGGDQYSLLELTTPIDTIEPPETTSGDSGKCDSAEVSLSAEFKRRLNLYHRERAQSAIELRSGGLGFGRGISREFLAHPDRDDPVVDSPPNETGHADAASEEEGPVVSYCHRCKKTGHWTNACGKKRVSSPHSQRKGKLNRMFWADEHRQKERIKQDRAQYDEEVRLRRHGEDLNQSQMRLQEDRIMHNEAQKARIAAERLLEDRQLRLLRDKEDLRVRADRMAEDRDFYDTFLTRRDAYMGK